MPGNINLKYSIFNVSLKKGLANYFTKPFLLLYALTPKSPLPKLVNALSIRNVFLFYLPACY